MSAGAYVSFNERIKRSQPLGDVRLFFFDASVDNSSLIQPTSGGAVTADSSGCANCVEPPRPQQWGPDLPFLGMPAMRTRWMAGAATHKTG